MSAHSYHCPCGWSRVILDGETEEDARRAHEATEVHRLATAETVSPEDLITITLPRADWEDVVGGMWRAAADTEHAADLPDYEPDEQAQLREDAVSYRRIGGEVERLVGENR
jgi:hypothetical protein